MNKKYAFLFPGQGAQYVGMGRDFYDHFSIAKQTFEEADEILGQNFSRLIFEGPSDQLTLTKNSQIGIYITSIAMLRTLAQQFPDLQPSVCAGLSLGEYTALTAAKKISFNNCLKLVKARAEFMNDACDTIEGSMQVILGLNADVVEEVLLPLAAHQVWVANINCPGQVVIAGTKSGIELATRALKEKGAKRALPLDVSGAFHSGLMKEAQERLTPYLMEVTLQTSPIDIVMNVPGDYVVGSEALRRCLIDQITQPVRWEKGICAIQAKGVDGYMEIGCGKTLSGMNKRIGVTAPTWSIEKISDLEGVLCNC